MLIARERGRTFIHCGVDDPTKIDRWVPCRLHTGTLRHPDGGPAKPDRKTRKEIKAQSVLGNRWSPIIEGRVDDRSKIDRRGPVGVLGRGGRIGSEKGD